MALMNTIPASISSTNRFRSAGSVVHALAPSPNGESLASRMASSTFRARNRRATGPNTSSWYAGESGVTPVSTVGSYQKPGPVERAARR